MNKTLRIASAVIALAVSGSTSAVATSINGTLNFSGIAATFDNTLDVATKVVDFGFFSFAGGGTGDYAGVGPLIVDLGEFTFSPALSPDPVTLWDFSWGGLVYSFDMESPLVVTRGGTALTGYTLEISGLGKANITGFDETAGSWIFTTQANPGAPATAQLSFSATTASPPAFTLPDGGSTVTIMGGSILALAIARRKRQ